MQCYKAQWLYDFSCFAVLEKPTEELETLTVSATVLVWPSVVCQAVRTIFSRALPGAVTFALGDFPGWATAVSACFGPMNEGPPWTTEVRVTWHIGMWGATYGNIFLLPRPAKDPLCSSNNKKCVKDAAANLPVQSADLRCARLRSRWLCELHLDAVAVLGLSPKSDCWWLATSVRFMTKMIMDFTSVQQHYPALVADLTLFCSRPGWFSQWSPPASFSGWRPWKCWTTWAQSLFPSWS